MHATKIYLDWKFYLVLEDEGTFAIPQSLLLTRDPDNLMLFYKGRGGNCNTLEYIMWVFFVQVGDECHDQGAEGDGICRVHSACQC
jgi:hypothetical protein